MQADDDLNPVAAADYAVGAQRFKNVVALGLRHIDQRDAQSGGAVIDAFDIARSAQRLQEAGGLAQFGVRCPGGAGFTARGLVIRFAVELNFTLFTARRFQVQAQNQSAEDNEVDRGEPFSLAYAFSIFTSKSG